MFQYSFSFNRLANSITLHAALELIKAPILSDISLQTDVELICCTNF